MDEAWIRGHGDGEAGNARVGPGSAREIPAGRSDLAGSPALGVDNKFVIIGSGYCFLPLVGRGPTPTPAGMRLAVVGGDPKDEGFIEGVDAGLADRRILLGYVLGSGEVKVHPPAEPLCPATRLRLREVFGQEASAGGRARWATMARGAATKGSSSGSSTSPPSPACTTPPSPGPSTTASGMKERGTARP